MIITDDNRKFLAGIIDDAIAAKGVLELVDGFAARVVLNVVDNFIDSKVEVSDEIKARINELIEAAKEKDLEACEVIAAALINDVVNIPMVDEEGEKLIFEGVVKIIVGAIKTWIKKD